MKDDPFWFSCGLIGVVEMCYMFGINIDSSIGALSLALISLWLYWWLYKNKKG